MTATNTSRQLFLAAVLLSLVLAVADLLVVTLNILLLMFAGVLFGIFLNGLSHWTGRRTRMPYRWSYLFVVVVLLGVTAAGVYYMWSQAMEQAAALWTEMQSAARHATDWIRQHEWAQKMMPETSEVENILTDGGLASSMVAGFRRVSYAVTGAAVIFFVGIYGNRSRPGGVFSRKLIWT